MKIEHQILYIRKQSIRKIMYCHCCKKCRYQENPEIKTMYKKPSYQKVSEKQIGYEKKQVNRESCLTNPIE